MIISLDEIVGQRASQFLMFADGYLKRKEVENLKEGIKRAYTLTLSPTIKDKRAMELALLLINRAVS